MNALGEIIPRGLSGLNFGSESVNTLSDGFMPLLSAQGCLEILSYFPLVWLQVHGVTHEFSTIPSTTELPKVASPFYVSVQVWLDTGRMMMSPSGLALVPQ